MHALEVDNLPDDMIKYLPSWAERFVENSRLLPIILRVCNPFSRKSELDFYGNYLRFQRMSIDKKVNKHLEKLYEIEGEWVGVNILTVDFEYMKRGKVKRDLINQIDEALRIKESHVDDLINVFMGIDPRRPNLIELVSKYIDRVDGFKLYCYNGFFPYDDRLDEFYQLASDNNKPIIFHCSDTNINYYGGKDIDELLVKSKFPVLPNRKGNKELSTNFCNPLGYVRVARSFPELKVIIAHWGGNDMLNGDMFFTNTITAAITALDNVFVDTSFFMNDNKAVNFIVNIINDNPKLIDKIFIATDFFMSETVANMGDMFGLKKGTTPEIWNHLYTNYDRIIK